MQTKRIDMKALVVTALGAAVPGSLLSCSSSSLQPTFSDKDTPEAAVVAQINPTVTVSCSQSKGHKVYYAGSTVTLHFVCDTTIGTVQTTSMPTWLTASASGTDLDITGTAPATASTTSWNFYINGDTTTGGSQSTQVITSTPTAALSGTAPDLVTNYGTGANLNFAAVSLDALWDGSTNDVTLSLLPQTTTGADLPADFDAKSLASTDTDVTSLKYYSDCTTASGTYICPVATAAAGTQSVTGGGEIVYAYSPWDQGSYTVDVRPLLTVEGAVMRLPTLKPTFTIPIQTVGGNVTLSRTTTAAGTSNTDDSAAFDVAGFPFGLALSTSASTVTKPVFGLVYSGFSAKKNGYFTHIELDRSVSAKTASPTGVTQSASRQENNAANDSQSYSVAALTDGSWAAVGIEAQELYYYHNADDASSPAAPTRVKLSNFSGSGDCGIQAAVSEPFTDPGTGKTAVGVLDMYTDCGADYALEVSKVYPATDTMDDNNFKPLANAPLLGTGIGAYMGSPSIHVATYNGTPTFFYSYWAQNANHDAYIARLSPTYSGAYSNTARDMSDDMTSPAAFAGDTADKQSLRLAVGTVGSKQIAAIAFRESDTNTASGGPFCYFRRIDTSLSALTRSAILQLSTNPCYNPSIQFNSSSGRFIVTYGEKSGTTYNIVEREITIGTTSDTASTAMTVVSGLTSWPAQLDTAFYSAANFMGLVYRVNGTDAPKVHGFHVSPF